MVRTRFLLPVWVGLLLLAGAACNDASNIGIGLVEEQGDPVVRVLTPSVFEAASLADVTGGAQRVLAGRAIDPLLGVIDATAYVDFVSAFDTSGGPTITGVSLVMARDYVYGDTTATVTLTLRDVLEDWTSVGARADTTLPTGPPLTTVAFGAMDTLVTAPLPDVWVADNDTTLRSDNFSGIFHGLSLEAASDGAVVGFDAAESFLRVFTDQDTLDYRLTRTLSGVVRSGALAVPENRLIVQDGAGSGVKVNFDFSDAGLEETPLNGAILRLFADTLTLQQGPPAFHRPLLETLQIVRVTDDDEVFVMGEATLTEDGRYRFSTQSSPGRPSLREVLQRTFLGEELYDHFEVRAPGVDNVITVTSNNTLDVMLLFDTAASQDVPEMVLTLSPAAN